MIRPRKDRDEEKEPEKEKRQRRRVVRPFWTGTISFGLINVPVQLFPAARRTSVSLRMLDEDGTPLRRRYYCPLDARLVESDEIVRGYELEDGRHVTVTDEELQAIEPKKTREIDLRRFVDLQRISLLFFDRAYFLTPTGDTSKAYRLLAAVMEQTGRAGIATFVMRGKEYLVAILAEGGILRAETLRFEEELRSAEDVGLPDPDAPDQEEGGEAVRRFEGAIRALEAEAPDPDEMTDEDSRRVRALAENKRKEGRDLVEAHPIEEEEAAPAGEDEEEPEEVDLLETIRISLKGQAPAPDDAREREERRGPGRDAELGPLEDLPKRRLYEEAQELDIEGRSRMDKDTLVREIRRRWRR